ncbi:MAG: zinc-dependent alcohol dehydrogenase family protein [Gammaproteobacteria bacterium]
MKAHIITQFGDPSVFKIANISKPELKPGHVILQVKATSVNQIDCKIRSGAVPDIAPNFPAVLHGDVAGIVVAVSSDVLHFKIGDEVYACGGGVKGTSGALAELMLVDAHLIAKKPKKISMSEAAALPLVSITAWEGLFLKARLQAGQTILIHGGVGGVGHIAVQLARAVKAKVFATVTSKEDFSLAKKFGALDVINAKDETVDSYVQRLTHGKGFDIIFDTVGGTNLDRSFAAAAIDGTVVTTAARSTHDLTPLHNKGLNLDVVFMLNPLLKNLNRAKQGFILKDLAALVDEGAVRPWVDSHSFVFDQISEAHALLESGQARGKVVLNNQ